MEFFGESSTDFKETATVGGFNYAIEANNFDNIFKESYDSNMAGSVNIMTDVNTLIENKTILENYKRQLIGSLLTEAEQFTEDVEMGGTHSGHYQQLSDIFDNCVADLLKESVHEGRLRPIKAVDFPVLVKSFLKLASKDIMQTEITKSPIVKKHIEQAWVVSNQDKTKRWKYPQCLFTNDFKEIYSEGKGLPIKPTPVTLPAFEYDVITNLTDAVDPSREEYQMTLEITHWITEDPDGGDDIKVPFATPMRIDLSTGQWVGGQINKVSVTGSAGTVVEISDMVNGMVDGFGKTVSVNCVNTKVKAVVFSGYLSNEKNERSVTFEYSRDEIEWKIEDGTRVSVPYSLETLEDHKALLDIDLYQKTYNHISDYMAQMEDNDVLAWLDEQFEKYDGIELTEDQLLGWSSFITKREFDCDSTTLTTALPCEYIEKMLKFAIDGLIIDIADSVKLEDMTFVVYGNPRFVRLLDPVVKWVTRPGSSSNGVKLDYGYGIMTSGDTKVQVVSTKKVKAKYDRVKKQYNGLRIIPFPLSKEQFTLKHYKYTTHVLTAANSAYRDPQLPGGSKTYLMGVSRYKNVAVQGIQAQMAIANAESYIKL